MAAEVDVAGGCPCHHPGRPVLADGFLQHLAGVGEAVEVVVVQRPVAAHGGEFGAQRCSIPGCRVILYSVHARVVPVVSIAPVSRVMA
nr:hypothetical protein [Streptomyces spinoverrucosus]